MSEQLWLIYQQTYFRWQDKPLTAQPFSIVSARNPLGNIASNKENQLLHYKLQTQLKRHAIVYAHIIAGDGSFHFTEPSFAIQQSLSEAIDLAEQYQQNAIFWVAEGALELIPVLLQQVSPISLGDFNNRLVSD